ncbi:MAG: hypothetical protein K2H91_10155 [Lachnospiraceae bacterium]|nr:hypothetical protein [Lachnospiraceae bacterium]
MSAQQQQKAIEALDRQKEKEQKQRYAMMHHLGAYMKLHYEGVILPYRVLFDLEKAEHEKTFTEVPPNPYYPAPAVTLATKYSKPTYTGDFKGLPLKTDKIMGEDITLPDLMADDEYRKKWEEYKQRVESEKLNVDRWDYWYGRFLLPYDLSSFTDFDWWGEIPKDEEAKHVVDGLRISCMEAQSDCKKHPENYNMEPVPRLREHCDLYDVGYGYI